MCTVTLIARRHGYALGMNRDEKLTRVIGLPPRLTRIHGRAILAPSEPGGGTWIGVNDTGAAFALINWYSITTRVAGQSLSRGDVVKRSLTAETAGDVDALLATIPLRSVNPFRLIGVFPGDRAVIEWRWNLTHLTRHNHPWRTNIWISSGLDEPGAQQTRAKTFRAALRQTSAGTIDWLRRLHRSHAPERGPYSICMHREDAATVSYSEVTVTRDKAQLSYTPGAPCCTETPAPLPLQLDLPAKSKTRRPR